MVATQTFFFQPDPWGSGTQFDEHIFQLGQLDLKILPSYVGIIIYNSSYKVYPYINNQYFSMVIEQPVFPNKIYQNPYYIPIIKNHY